MERIGPAPRSGSDEVFLQPPDLALRLRLGEDVTRRAALGDGIRSWGIETRATAIVPELGRPHGRAALDSDEAWARFLWRYRSLLSHRAKAGFRSATPGDFWAWYDSPLPLPEGVIACPQIATHNHFALVPEGVLVTGGALLLRASRDLSEEQRLALLGYLNSSTACYWMKHVLFSKVPVGAVLASVGMHPEDNLYEFSAVGLQRLPIPDFVLADCLERSQLATLARRLTRTARDARERTPARVLARWNGQSQGALFEALASAQQEDVKLLREMVRDQEDLDWLVYASLGLADVPFEPSAGTALPEHRPFAWLSEEPPATLAPELVRSWRARRRARPLAQYIEHSDFKRPRQSGGLGGAMGFDSQLARATEEWLAERIEDAWRGRASPSILERAELVDWMDRSDVRAVCSLRGADVEASVAQLLDRYAVPFLPALRYTSAGLEKRSKWIRAWEAQRAEDTGEAPSGQVARPPSYSSGDYVDPTVFRIRGKLDVARERFLFYPRLDGSTEGGFGWAGWSCRERISALLSLIDTSRARGEPKDHILPLLCGLLELLPSIQQEERQGTSGTGPDAETVRRFTGAEAERLGITVDEIREWRPPAATPHRRAQRAHRTRASRRR